MIIPDFRAPNNIRLGITPLYTSYEEIHTAMEQVKFILEQKIYEKYPGSRDSVT